MESDPLLICMDELERQEKQNEDIEFDNNNNSQDILDKFQLHAFIQKKLPSKNDKGQILSDFKS
jgi:hypothetical protein